MKTFVNCAAQGDVMFVRVSSIPSDAIEVKAEDGKVIVTHSESGHHHVIDAKSVRMFRLASDEGGAGMIGYLCVTKPSELKHLRPHDTHESILFSPGNYEVRRQREYTPEGWRRVED